MSLDVRLLLGLLMVLAGMQAVCFLLARGLGRRLEWPVAAVGIALPLALLFPWLDRGRLMVPADLLQEAVPGAPRVPASHQHDLLNDAIYQFLPWELEVRHALRDGRLPLWSDTLEGGSSPWVNPQAAAVSPIAMPARVLPIQHHLLVTLALKMLVAFEGAWLLARTVGVRRAASLIAAGSFALGGGLMAWALFPHSAAVAWVPWLTAAVIRLFRGSGGGSSARVVATAALLTAALLLSGHPETAAVGGLFAAVCGLSLARRRSFVRGLGSAALAAVLGCGLAAPQILPFVLDLPHSQRAQEMLASELPPYRAGLAPISWFLPGYGQLMLAPLGPYVYGRPYQDPFRGPFNWSDADSGYAGLVALAGSLVALIAVRRRRRRALPFLGFAFAGLLLASQLLPLAIGIHAVAALRTVAWARFLPVGCLALAVAGGMGIDRILGRSALGALGGMALALVLVIDLGPWAYNHLPATSPALFYPRTDFLEILIAEAGQGGPWRAVGEGQTLFPSLLPVYGVAEVRPHNPLAPMPYLRALQAAFGFAPTTANYFPSFDHIDHPFLDFLGVRVVASTAGHPPPVTLTRIDGGRFGPFRLYRNPDALPRWFLPAAAEVIREDQVPAWIAGLKDARRVAVFDRRAAGWTGEPGVSGAVVTGGGASPGRIALQVSGTGERLLATSIHGAGWRAESGGRRLETVVIDGAFVGVHVPAGVSQVDLRYTPPGFVAGLLLGAAALAVTTATAVLASRGRPGRAG